MPRRKQAPEEKFVKQRDTLRRFRIWDAHKQVALPGRNYRWPENAHDAAAVICRREVRIGHTVEVLDKGRAVLVGTYTKTSTGIRIKPEKVLREEEKQRKSLKGESE